MTPATSFEWHVFAVVLDAAWTVAGLLALLRFRGFAIAVNILIALVFGAWVLPPLFELLIDFDGYVLRHGRAALSDVPLTIVIAVLSVIAIALSLFSRRRAAGFFVAGWLANAPVLILVTYLAFWFRIFS